MTLSQDTVWEVRTTGNDANGGGFVTGSGGTDYSQQTSPQATLSVASVVDATTTTIDVAVGDYTVASTDVGNTVQITGGTATAGWYQIQSVNVGANKWVMDRSVGTAAQTIVGRMGGCLATPGAAGLAVGSGGVATGQYVWIQSGTYNMTSNQIAKGGTAYFKSPCTVEGYGSTRGDLGTKPILANNGQYVGGNPPNGGGTAYWGFGSGAQSGDLVGGTYAPMIFINLTAQGDYSGTGTGHGYGFLIATQYSKCIDCYATAYDQGYGASGAGGGSGMAQSTQSGTAIGCKAYLCATGGFCGQPKAIRCWADKCAIGTGVVTSGGFEVAHMVTECLATNCGNSSNLSTGGFWCEPRSDGGGSAGTTATVDNLFGCTADRCTIGLVVVGIGSGGSTDGSFFGADTVISNCTTGVTTFNQGFGVVADDSMYFDRLAFYNNTANTSAIASDRFRRTITLTASPYNNPGLQDYGLNNAAGGGATLTAAGYNILGQISDTRNIGSVQTLGSALSMSNVVEGSTTLGQFLVLFASVLLGKASGLGTGTDVFRDTQDTLNRIVAVSDTSGNRTSITLDSTGAPTGLLSLATTIEGGITFQQLIAGMASVLLNKSNGLGTATVNYRDLADTKNRINSIVDTNGNRTTVTLNLT